MQIQTQDIANMQYLPPPCVVLVAYLKKTVGPEVPLFYGVRNEEIIISPNLADLPYLSTTMDINESKLKAIRSKVSSSQYQLIQGFRLT